MRVLTMLAATGVIWAAGYMLWMFAARGFSARYQSKERCFEGLERSRIWIANPVAGC